MMASSFYGHKLSRDALSQHGLWPYPVVADSQQIQDGRGA
jgi:hypothetical protein